MSKFFPEYYGMVGGLHPVSKEMIVVGDEADCQKTMDFGVDFETFIKNTTSKLVDISDDKLASVGIHIERNLSLNTIYLKLNVGLSEYTMMHLGKKMEVILQR